MSYDSKIAELKKRLQGVVKFDNQQQAEDYANVHRKSKADPAWKSLCEDANDVLCDQDRFGVRDLLRQIGGCDETRLSAIREAIRQIAAEQPIRRWSLSTR